MEEVINFIKTIEISADDIPGDQLCIGCRNTEEHVYWRSMFINKDKFCTHMFCESCYNNLPDKCRFAKCSECNKIIINPIEVKYPSLFDRQIMKYFDNEDVSMVTFVQIY